MHAGTTQGLSPVMDHMCMTATTSPIDDLSAIPVGRNSRCNAMQTLDLAQISDMLPAKAFRQMSAFGALSDNFVEQVLAGGELLVSPRRTRRCFSVALKGHLTIYQDTAAGRKVIRTTSEGESVGFAAMLAMWPRLFSGATTGECLALTISCEALARLQELDSQQFEIFFINLSRDMSRFKGDCIRRAPAEDT